MSIPYKFYKPQKNFDTMEEDHLFPRVVVNETINTDTLAERMTTGNTLTLADAKAALSALAEAVARELSMGNNVHIDQIGTLSLSLTTDQKVTKHRYLHDIHMKIRKVLLHPDRELIYRCEREGFEQKSPKSKTPQEEERRKLLNDYLLSHRVINVTTYRTLTGLYGEAARTDLQKWVKEGWLTAMPFGRGFIYSLK